MACLITEDEERALCLIFNAGSDAVDFILPAYPPGAQWRLAVDTFGEAPLDFFAFGEELLLEYPHNYRLSPRSSAILLAWKTTFSAESGSQ